MEKEDYKDKLYNEMKSFLREGETGIRDDLDLSEFSKSEIEELSKHLKCKIHNLFKLRDMFMKEASIRVSDLQKQQAQFKQIADDLSNVLSGR